MSGQAVIKISTTSKYALKYNDEGSGADLDGAFHRPTPEDSAYFILGDYCQGNYNPPYTPVKIIKVTGDDSDSPILRAPTDYKLVWKDSGSGADKDGSVWYPVPPEGYVSLGYVGQEGHDKPNISNYRCLRLDKATQGKVGPLIWKDSGSGADDDIAIYQIMDSSGNSTGFFYAQPNYDSVVATVYTLEGLL